MTLTDKIKIQTRRGGEVKKATIEMLNKYKCSRLPESST